MNALEAAQRKANRGRIALWPNGYLRNSRYSDTRTLGPDENFRAVPPLLKTPGQYRRKANSREE